MSTRARVKQLGLMQLYMQVEEELVNNYRAIDALNQRTRGDVIPPGKVVKTKGPRAPRSMYCRHWLLQRPLKGQFQLLMDELQLKDVKAFINYTRMSPTMFFAILGRLRPRIKKKETNFKKPISSGFRLAIALRYYATGDAYKDMM